MILLILLALVAISQQCCMSDKMEGYEEILVGSVVPGGSQTSFINQSINFSYDATKKMIFANGTTNTNGKQILFRALMDYNKNITYTVVNNTCTKSQIPSAFFGPCLDDDKVVRNGYIGTGVGRKNIRVYQFEVQGLTASVTVDENCTLIDEVYYGNNGKVNVMGSLRASDITVGIRDESVFNVPAICKQRDNYHSYNRLVSQMHQRHTRSIHLASRVIGPFF